MDDPNNLAKGDSAKLSVSDLDTDGLAPLTDVANLIDGTDTSGFDDHSQLSLNDTCMKTDVTSNVSINVLGGDSNESHNDDIVASINDSLVDDEIRQHAELMIEQLMSECINSLHAQEFNESRNTCMLAIKSEPLSPADSNTSDTTNPSASSESASESDSSVTSNQSGCKVNNNKRKKKNYRKKSNSSSSLTSSPVASKAKKDLTSPKVADSVATKPVEVKVKSSSPKVEVKAKKASTSPKPTSENSKALSKTEPKCQTVSGQLEAKVNGALSESLPTEANKSSFTAGGVQSDAISLANTNQTNNPALDDNPSKTKLEDLPCELSSESSLVSEPSDDQSMEDADSKTKSNGGKTFGQNVTESMCRICSKHVYHMEQIKAVKSVFHKACFRCKECNKQLNGDSYSSHEGIIYCKPHFKQLFQPKAVFANDDSKQQPTRKYELIICENTPQELPADVIRSSAKQDEVLENINLDLSNIRNRFENGSEKNSEGKKSNEKLITRSESIHKIMQKYQSRVAGDKDLTSSSDEEDKPESPSEHKVAFSGMSALKSQWESGSINSNAKSENSVEEELAELRQKTSEPIKQAYERAVQEAKSVENLSAKNDNIVSDCSVKAVSIKEKFEKGKVESETEEDRIERLKKDREEEISRIAVSETCTKEARNKFKQIEANMGKEQQSNGTNGQIEDISISSNDLQERFKYFENLKDSQANFAKENDETDSNVDDIPKADTTKKMLDKFKALEAGQTNGQVNGAPKSPRRITPPRETVKNYENEPLVERDPNIVKSSYKSDEDIQVEPEKAKNLRAKFENWQAEIASENRKTEEDEYVPHIDTTKNLRAMFESIKEEYKPIEKTRPRINRFVDNKAPMGEVCYVCSARLYPMEKMEFSGIKIHKNCFRCNKCHAPLRLDNFTVRAEKLFCIPHFKQLFMEKGNYDEGFGLEQHKDKWSHKSNGKTNGIDQIHDNDDLKLTTTNGNGNGVCDDQHLSDNISTEGEEDKESLNHDHEQDEPEPEDQVHHEIDDDRRELELDEVLDGPITVDNLL